jgi:DNA-binding transcriptional LysR family regulator
MTLRVVAPPGQDLVARWTGRLTGLEGQTLLLSRSDCSYRKLFQQALAEEGVRPAAVLEFNSIEAIKRCVAAGAGVTILPALAVAREVDRGELAALPLRGGDLEVAMLMIWQEDKWLSPGLRAFMEAARQGLAGQPLPE